VASIKTQEELEAEEKAFLEQKKKELEEQGIYFCVLALLLDCLNLVSAFEYSCEGCKRKRGARSERGS
jgi:hypothetical protein